METVKINMVPKGAVKAAHASQGDAPRVVRFELFDEFLPYTLDGSEDITLTVIRPDTEEIVSTVTNTEEAYIDVSFTSEMTAIRGVANCEIKISKSGAVIGSHNFDLNIERDAYGEDITVETAQGVIATFTTGVIDNLVGLKTTFEPKQDLHGYETPWIDSNVVNKAPYLSRALSGTASRIGNYEYNKLVGGTYAFNQLAPENNSSNYYGADATTTTADGVTTISDPQARFAGWRMRNNTDSYIGNNHKLLILSDLKINWSGKMVSVYYNNGNHQVGFAGTGRGNYNADTWYTIGAVISVIRDESSNNGRIVIQNDNQDYTGQEWSVRNIQMINLTQLFGSTIADYIYSLETAQAGDGVAYFKALFDKDYYAYNAGELISVKPTAHITKDGNNTVISNTALDPDLELRGIPKLDENNKLYYDGDTYESNGDVTRRYGIVDLGSLTWEYIPDYTFWRSTGIASLVKTQASQMDMVNFIAYPYVIHNTQSLINLGLNCLQVGVSGNLWVNNGSDSVTPSGYLVYELATPTTESADPFTDPQEIDASGSEEFIDARAVSIPVGHESYYANICEIEGIDDITFYRAGKNINSGLSEVTIQASSSSISPAITREYLKAGETYTFSCYQDTDMTSNTRNTLRINKVNDNSITWYENTTQNYHLSKGLHSLTVTIQESGEYDFLIWGHSLSDTTLYKNFQLEKGSQASEYKAYTGESALVEIGQTVYGGYYDKDLGIVLTSKLVDLGSLSFGAGFGGFYTGDIKNEIKIVTNLETPNLLSSAYKAIAYSNLLTDINTVAIVYGGADYAYNGIVVFNDTRYPDAASFKAAMNGVTLCYELATPIIIPADAVNFETEKGVNNVWSDTNGETEVKFYVKEA